MSHSRVLDEYLKLMTEGMLKTADKKDEDYNVIPESAGADSTVEESGWELVEIAHPDQVQVADSRLNDGIVENGVEAQKLMIDVARRSPRGVLASLMETLVKAANVLDDEMSDESIKMAGEIDNVLSKLAQENFYSADTEFEAMKSALEGIATTFPNLNYGFFGVGGKDTKVAIDRFTAEVRRYVNMSKGVGPGQKKQWTQAVAAFIRANEQRVSGLLADAKDDVAFIGTAHKDAALRAWNDATTTANGVAATDKAQPAQEKEPVEQRQPSFTTVPTVQPQDSAASKAPAHHRFLTTPEVKKLQQTLGVEQDSKFGPQTFGALQEAAKTNSDLDQLLQNMPKTYQGWNNAGVGEALQRLQAGKASAQQVQKEPYSMMAEKNNQPEIHATDTKLEDRLKGLYPQVKFWNNKIYPYGFGSGPSFPSYPATEQWMSFLEKGGTK